MEHFEILNAGMEVFPGFVTVFKGLKSGHRLFRQGGIVPEIRRAGL
jgi:hypothetical protein